MSTEAYKPKSKTLTSYRRMILRKYNAKPADMSDDQFCYRYRIPLGELQFWQQLAGQELQIKLNDMAEGKRNIAEDDWYTYATFQKECAKVIEVTCGGRPVEKVSSRPSEYHKRCELLRYEVLQRVAQLPNSYNSELLLRYIQAELKLW